MLSKVLKGGEALRMQAIVFADVQQPGRSAHVERSRAEEEQPGLSERVRQLEMELAAARREAFDAGRRQGEEEARAAVTPVLARLNASIEEITGMRPELRRRAEKDAVELALKIAERVLHRELSIDDNALNALARVVFDRLARAESWQLTVHPRFADSLRVAIPAGRVDKVRVDADSSCEPGTLRIRYDDGEIDASIDRQLAEIGRGLTDRLVRK